MAQSVAPGSASARASEMLDAARAALVALEQRPPAEIPGGRPEPVLARAVELLVWAGGWLDDPYRPDPAPPAPTGGADGALRRLDELTFAFEELVEAFEEEDPVANANGVQTGSLAFAIVSDVVSRLRRLASSPLGQAERRDPAV